MITVEIQGLDKIVKALKRAPEVAINELGTALSHSMRETESEAKKQAPVNKQSGGGTLRQNIKQKRINRLRGEVVSNAKYSGYVHEGTRPHIIRYKKSGRGGLYDKRTKRGFGRVVRHPGTKANPYMKRALEISEAKINNFFQEALNKIASIIK